MKHEPVLGPGVAALAALTLGAAALMASVLLPQGLEAAPAARPPAATKALASFQARQPLTSTSNGSAAAPADPVTGTIGFRNRAELEATRPNIGQGTVWLDLASLDTPEAAVDLAEHWRSRLGATAALECWITGASLRDALSTANALTRACSQTWVVD